MIRRRSVSESDPHCTISVSVRPQPQHSPDRESIVQTFVQGDEIDILRRECGQFGGQDKDQGAKRNAFVVGACPFRKTGTHPGSSPGQAFSGTCAQALRAVDCRGTMISSSGWIVGGGSS